VRLYHGTNSDQLPAIRKRGLLNPYLSNVLEVAQQYAEAADGGGDPVVITVDVDPSLLRVDRPSLVEPVGYGEYTGEDMEQRVSDALDELGEQRPECVLEPGLVEPPDDAYWVTLEACGTAQAEGVVKWDGGIAERLEAVLNGTPARQVIESESFVAAMNAAAASKKAEHFTNAGVPEIAYYWTMPDGVQVSGSSDGTNFHLDRLQIPPEKRRQGLAKQWLAKLGEIADQTGTSLTGFAVPDEGSNSKFKHKWVGTLRDAGFETDVDSVAFMTGMTPDEVRAHRSYPTRDELIRHPRARQVTERRNQYIWIGYVSNSGNVRAKRVNYDAYVDVNGETPMHGAVGMHKGTRWRYPEGANCVFWWERPTDDQKERVDEFMAAHGLPRVRHKSEQDIPDPEETLNYAPSNDFYDVAHGHLSPKDRPEYALSPDALRSRAKGKPRALSMVLAQESKAGDNMIEDFYRINTEVQEEFGMGGEPRQSWTLVPKAKLVRLYREYGKYGRINDRLLKDVWSVLSECVQKICINSDIKDGRSAPDFFNVESYDEIPEEDWDRWFQFISDRSGSNLIRNTGELGTGGNGRYSDQSRRLGNMMSRAYTAEQEDPEQLLLAVDQLLNFAHGLGNMAHWLVEGGVATLDEIADFAPKGITGAGLR